MAAPPQAVFERGRSSNDWLAPARRPGRWVARQRELASGVAAEKLPIGNYYAAGSAVGKGGRGVVGSGVPAHAVLYLEHHLGGEIASACISVSARR